MRLPKVRGGACPRVLSSAAAAFFPNPLRSTTVATATSRFPFSFSKVSSSFPVTSAKLVPPPLPPLWPHFSFALFSSSTLSPSPSGPKRRREPDETKEDEWVVEWEEEEEAEPMIGDGGDGGGIVLGDVGWGERALSVAREVLQLQFGDDFVMYAFKVSPRGYIYVRLDKLTNKYLSDRGTAHWRAPKKVMQHLRRTKDYTVAFDGSSCLNVLGYSDENWKVCKGTL